MHKSQANQNRPKPLPTATKIGYGAVEGACSMLWTIYLLFFLFFLTDVAGVDPVLAGTIMMIGVLWDGFTDPLIGILSDRSRSKWGRRRPFLLAFAVPIGISYWLLFTDWGFTEGAETAYYIFAVILFFTCFTSLNIPTSALAPEMTRDHNERISLLSYRAAWSQVFSIAGSTIPLILVAWLSTILGDHSLAWSVAGAFFGLAAIPLTLTTWRATRGREIPLPPVESQRRSPVSGVFSNRVFRWTIGIWTSALIAQAVLGTTLVYFMTYRVGLDEAQLSAAYLVLFVSSTLWVPVIRYLASRFGKRATFTFFAILWSMVQCSLLLVESGDFLLLCMLFSILGAGVVLPWQLGWAMLSDVVEVDEFRSGERREGIYFGIAAFVQKAASGVAVFIVGWTLSHSGYQPDVEQSQATLSAISWVSSMGVAVFALLAAAFVWKLPLTRTKHQALLRAITARSVGDSYDTSQFDDII